MGKSRRVRVSKAATSPLDSARRPGAAALSGHEHEPDDELSQAERNPKQAIATVQANLEKGTRWEQMTALHSVALLSNSTGFAKKLIESGILRVVAPLMLEDAPLGAAGVGAAKNLSLAGPEVCEQMIKQDIMTPLQTLFQRKFSNPETSLELEVKNKSKKNESGDAAMEQDNPVAADQDSGDSEEGPTDLFMHAVHLLCILCEASETAVTIANKEDLVTMLLEHLQFVYQRPEIPQCAKVKLTLLQCLYSMSEDNTVAATSVAKCLQLFKNIFESVEEPVQARVLAIGVVLNSANSSSESLSNDLWLQVVEVLKMALSSDLKEKVASFINKIPTLENNSETEFDKQLLCSERDNLREIIQSQQTALEILTNMCCSEDQDGQWEDDTEDDYAGEDDTSSGGSSSQYMGTVASILQALPPELTEALQAGDMLELVLSKANLPDDAILDRLNGDGLTPTITSELSLRQLLRMLKTVRARAFLCVNNMITAITINDQEIMHSTWLLLGQLCFAPNTDMGDSELLESATSALRALTHRLSEMKSPKLALVEHSDLKAMLSFTQRCTEQPEIRANMVEIMGLVAIAAIQANKKERLKDASLAVAQYLLDTAARETNLRVASEALDKIFDLFAEDETDPLAVEVSLLPRLQGMLPGFKTKMQMQKKALSEETWGLACMAKTNLIRFIKYKAKRLELKTK